ncbi:MAG: ion channel [Rhizomicrobium sp.]
MEMQRVQRVMNLPPSYPRIVPREWQPRRAVVKGQDGTQWRDAYHFVIRAPWWAFFSGVAFVFALVNTVFALLYMGDPRGIENAHGFWDYFLFSVQTIGSANYTVMVPKSVYANIVVSVEAFFGILNLALVTGVTFARFSRPFARVVFSRVAVITPFDGVPTLMFRAANQRGNQILDAAVSVSLARQVTTQEGIVMRRFQELKLLRARTPLFGLSWTVMHPIDRSSPLHGATDVSLQDSQMEIIVLLSGTDDALAEIIYARHSYMPDEILWNRRFVDVLALTASGRRVVDLRLIHETEALPDRSP